MSAAFANRPPDAPRAPAVPVALALAGGILADRYAGPAAEWWLIGSGLLVAAWWGCWWRGRLRAGAGLLLAAILAAGGAWHHIVWSCLRSDDLLSFADRRGRNALLIARVASDPEIVPASTDDAPRAMPDGERTVCVIEARELVSVERRVRASGRARLEIDGRVTDVRRGDVVRVLGELSAPAPARNPGGFDFRDVLRADGIRTVFRCGHPEALALVERPGTRIVDWPARCRVRLAAMLSRNLSGETAGVAIALLLGPKAGITPELRDAFADTGLAHILAISGLNVAILALFLWGAARMVGSSSRWTMLAMLIGIVVYAAVTSGEPSVVRATMMLGVYLGGRLTGRLTSAANHLGLAALAVLVRNPADLFQVGAQFSFLAVMALHAGERTWQAWAARTTAEAVPVLDRPAWQAWLLAWGRSVLHAYWLTLAVWAFTLPLTLSRFHQASPLGFVMNVVLMPWVTLTLWLGYALLIFGGVAPFLAPPLAWLFESSLAPLLRTVQWTAGLRWGMWHLPGPSDVWLAVFYLLLAVLAAGVGRRWLKRVAVRGLLAWCVLGLALPLWPRSDAGLKCTFLSVGHGVAILIEFPDGRTLLYDGGSLQNPERASRAVVQGLWQAGHARLDAAIASHADIDHFNGLRGVMDDVPIGQLWLTPQFVRSPEGSAQWLVESAAANGVPLRLTWAGDAWTAPAGVRLEVLHPAPEFVPRRDNTASLALLVEYAGRKFLLAGDLEQEGMAALLALPACDVDVLLSPHHGSRQANLPILAAWCRPEHVVQSGGRIEYRARLCEVYGEGCRVYSTLEDGAVTIHVAPDGGLNSRVVGER